MRKLLLATAATFGATLAMTGGAMAQPVKPVAPGTVVVHVNGYLQFEIGDTGSTDNTVKTASGTDKLNPVTTDGDARIYAGFDAQTVSGLDYGAQIELRTSTSEAGVRVGANQTTGLGTANSDSGLDGIYVKRAYGYIGAPDTGFVRVGQGDSVFSLDQAGVVEAFGDGAQYNTDGGTANLLPSDASVGGQNNFIYADASNLYATDKVVLLSPAIDGLSAGVGYEPNSNGLKEGYSDCSAASATDATSGEGTCAAEYSSADPADIGKRRKNTIDAALQYVLDANGFKTKLSGALLYGAPINYDGAAEPAGSPLHKGFDTMSVYQFGAQTTVAGFTLGANVKGGQVEDGYAFKPKGARDAIAFIVGATYVLGPYVLGASIIDSQSAGSYPGTLAAGVHEARTLSEYGAAVGGNYVISPNLSLFTQYLYDHRHQPGNSGLDVSGGPGTTAKGDAQAQAVAVGATFKW
jgi:uncharacterized low-complexity protein